MTGDLSIQTTARDLVLNLNDSCNCCCWKGKKLSPKTHVYVNQSGEVQVFDPKKAEDTRIAMARCLSNLSVIMDNMSDDIEGKQKEALIALKKRVIKNDENPPSPITLEIIEDVLRIRHKIRPNYKMI